MKFSSLGTPMALTVSGYKWTSPCPLMSTYLSVITMSWETAVGPDGQLDTEELDLWKSDLVQAVGHFMGLIHVIDISSTTLDSLYDTPACERLEECETLAGDNVMFPYPVCSSDGCINRDQLTASTKRATPPLCWDGVSGALNRLRAL